MRVNRLDRRGQVDREARPAEWLYTVETKAASKSLVTYASYIKKFFKVTSILRESRNTKIIFGKQKTE